MCVSEKKQQKSNPHIGTGTPRISMGRDLSIFQIGESQKRYGVHSNLGTNMPTWRPTMVRCRSYVRQVIRCDSTIISLLIILKVYPDKQQQQQQQQQQPVHSKSLRLRITSVEPQLRMSTSRGIKVCGRLCGRVFLTRRGRWRESET